MNFNPGREGSGTPPVLENIDSWKSKTLYQRLGVSSTADAKEIKTAFRKLSLKYHPDKVDQNEKLRANYEEVYKLITEAYTTLTDPGKKAAYGNGSNSSSSDFYRDTTERTKQTYYTRQETAPPGSKTVKNGAIMKAARGAFWYGEYVKEMTRAGFKDTANLLKDPEIQDVIINNAIGEAARGAFWYGEYVKDWEKQKFQRSILDNNPKILVVIKEAAIGKAKQGAFWYGEYVKDWREKGGINLQNLIQTPIIYSLIKKEALVRARQGVFWFKEYVKEWEEKCGFNRVAFLSDPDLQRLVKEGAEAESGKGGYWYDSFSEEWQKVGISVKK